MSTRKPTPDILDSVLGAIDVDATDETIVELPAFQPAAPAPKPRSARPNAQIAPAKEPAQTVSAPTPPAPIIVKPVEWEYREVIVRDYRGWRVRSVNGRELSNWKSGPTLNEYLETAGREGWELVSIGDRHHNQKDAYLKRIKG